MSFHRSNLTVCFTLAYDIVNLDMCLKSLPLFKQLPYLKSQASAKRNSGLFPAGCARNIHVFPWSLDQNPEPPQQQLYSDSFNHPPTCWRNPWRPSRTFHSWPEVRAWTKINQHTWRALPSSSAPFWHNSAEERIQNCTCCSSVGVDLTPHSRTRAQGTQTWHYTKKNALESSPSRGIKFGWQSFPGGGVTFLIVVVLQHSSMKVEKNPVSNSQREHLQVITITSISNVFIAQPKSQPGSLIRHERCFSLGIYLKCRTDRMCFTFIYLIRHFRHMESFCLNLKSSYMLSHRTFYVLSSKFYQSLHQGY